MISEPNYSEMKEYVKYCEALGIPVCDQHSLDNYLSSLFRNISPNIRPDLLIAVARVLFIPEFFVYKGCTFRVLAPNIITKQELIEEYELSRRYYHEEQKGKWDPEKAIQRLEIFRNWFCITDTLERVYGIDLGKNNRFLAECVAAAWRGALLTQFPEEKFIVELWNDDDDIDDGIGFWELTFYHASPHPGLKWWLE